MEGACGCEAGTGHARQSIPGYSGLRWTDWANKHLTGNAQLLEAAPTCAEVLPRRRGPEGAITKELHFWLLGGTYSLQGSFLSRQRQTPC